MMKLYQYLTEDKAQEIEYDDPEKAYYKIIKDCRKYFGLLGKKKPLYRAVNTKIFGSDIYLKKKTRENRIPRINSDISEFINYVLGKMGHIRRDQSISVTPNYKHAEMFKMKGSVYYFFPIGNFDYSWAPTMDWNFSNEDWNTNAFLELVWDLKNKNSKVEKKIAAIDVFKRMFSLIKTNNGFDTAYNKNYEIWFKCKEYYLVEPNSELGRLF